MLADELDYVVGVDHSSATISTCLPWSSVPTGAVIAQRPVPATARGYSAALRVRRGVHAGTTAVGDRGAGHYETLGSLVT